VRIGRLELDVAEALLADRQQGEALGGELGCDLFGQRPFAHGLDVRPIAKHEWHVEDAELRHCRAHDRPGEDRDVDRARLCCRQKGVLAAERRAAAHVDHETLAHPGSDLALERVEAELLRAAERRAGHGRDDARRGLRRVHAGAHQDSSRA
jgi:hypothetical protein